MAELKRGTNVGIVLDVEAKPRPWQAPVSDETPFRILILANLSGARTRRDDLASRSPARIDRDNFEPLLSRFEPSVKVGQTGRTVVTMSELDDFHPDQLWARLALFEPLRSLRKRLDDPRVFEMAVREWLGGRAAPAAPDPTTGGGSVLDQMLEQTSGPGPRAKTPPPDEFQEEIRRLVQPHLLPGDDPRKSALTERLDAAAAELMRAVLHDPEYQAIEAVWRALYLLVRRIETDEEISIWVLDASREEIEADLADGRGIERSALYRVLVDETSASGGATPWAVIVSNLTFGPDTADLSLLASLAALAQLAGAPLLAGASPALAGSPAFDLESDPADWGPPDPRWAAFRKSPLARFVGLALPRFLGRVPYGQSGEPCDAIEFEELPSPPNHRHYLWSNAAFACTLLLAESFAQASWAMRPGAHQDLDGLPLHVAGGQAKPCAETLMSERMAARLLEAGLMPLASMKDRDAVRLVRFQSVADPPAGLAGRWNTREA
jgi:type VI secretion system protein ImpC